MNIREFEINGCPCVEISGIKNFDVNKIFDCGQCFRFDRVENSAHKIEFSGVAFGKFVSFAQDDDVVIIYGSSISDYENIWRSYLCIDQDYDKIGESILEYCKNNALAAAVKYGRGIRILAQDPFECIISFIISQNNNIPRIKKIIEALSAKCNTPIDIHPEMQKHLSGKSSLCAFPDVQKLYALGIDGLVELKTGFRAKYIYDAVSRSLDGSLSIDEISNASDTDAAIEKLCTVKGIGEKVASCALLFGFRRYDAFPIDVWMKRVGVKYFGEGGDNLNAKQFGPYAGIAQQYLFYYERYRTLENK